jgi:outer membrane protein assembly factor BamE (lipoprotein component of BamABCDE complex)
MKHNSFLSHVAVYTKAFTFWGTALGVLAVVSALASCAETVNTHGTVVLPSRLAQIKVFESTKDDVQNLLGTPSTTGTLNDNRWYYVTRVEGKTAFTPHILKDQSVYVLDFDPSGTLISMTKKTGADGKSIHAEPDATPTRGQSEGFISQMFGNLGQMMKP